MQNFSQAQRLALEDCITQQRRMPEGPSVSAMQVSAETSHFESTEPIIEAQSKPSECASRKQFTPNACRDSSETLMSKERCELVTELAEEQLALCDILLRETDDRVSGYQSEGSSSESEDLLDANEPSKEARVQPYVSRDDVDHKVYNLLNEHDLQGAASEVAAQSSPKVAREHGNRSRSSSTGQGIINVFGRSDWYRAIVSTGNFRFLSRRVEDLTLALDFLVVLTALKLRVKQCSDFASFAQHVRTSVHAILLEHEITPDQLGLIYCVPVHIKCFFGPGARVERNTPFYSDLDQALRVWERLNEFRWHRDFSHRSLRKDRRLRLWMQTFFEEWPHFRNIYLDILEEGGHSRSLCKERLDQAELASQRYRDKHIELWNARAMKHEDVRQRRVDAASSETSLEQWNQSAMEAEERQQRRALAKEKHVQLWNLRAMASAERSQRRALANEGLARSE